MRVPSGLTAIELTPRLGIKHPPRVVAFQIRTSPLWDATKRYTPSELNATELRTPFECPSRVAKGVALVDDMEACSVFQIRTVWSFAALPPTVPPGLNPTPEMY